MKSKTIFVYLIIFISVFSAFSQAPLRVADLSFKINSNNTQEFCYSFTEGDVIVVDFELIKGKGIDFEVIELPSLTKIKQYTARISNYRINVTSTNVYLFRISNGLGNKLCSLSIKRIPKSSETANYNTGWQWKTLYDTTYVNYQEDSLVGHDTVHYTETVKEVSSREINEEYLVETTEEIRSSGIVVKDNPRTYIEIKLPHNQYDKYVDKIVRGWGCWLCVGDNSENFWNKNKNYISQTVSTIAGKAIGPIGAFVAGGVTSLIIPGSSNDNVAWSILQSNNDVNLFMRGGAICPYSCLRNGDGPGAFVRFVEDHTQGTYYICLYNDNPHKRIRVTVKVSALVETIIYKDVEYQRTKIVPKYVKLAKTRMDISSRQIRVPVENSR